MKKKILSFLMASILLTAGLATNAGAIGFGMYFNMMSGSSDWDVDSDIDGDLMDYDDSDDWDADAETTSVGFVFDTTLARNQKFNYRFEIGLEKSEVDLDIDFGDFDTDGKADVSGLVMTHDFGYGVYRTKDVRIWIGPELKLSFLSGEIDVDEPRGSDADIDCDVEMFKFGVGPVAGLNFNIEPQLSLSVKVGVLFQKMTGEGDVDIEYNDFLDSHDSGDQDYEASDTYFFINFSIFYRLNDHF